MSGREVVVHLTRPEDLVTVDPAGLYDDPDARSVPGAEEIVDELLARGRPGRHDRVVVTLPPTTAGPDPAATAAHLQTVLRRWCVRRNERGEREGAVLWRQGLNSLRPGIPLFLIGLLFSTGFLEPDVPAFLQDVLGNGVFLVIAWVGLWYPLDLFFFARLPLRREHRVLDALLAMPVEVRVREVAPRE